jgi:hypothetical protein
MERYFWGITILIVLLSAISGYDTPINLQNIIELVLWCASVPIFFAFFFHLAQAESKKIRFVTGSIFIVSSTFSLFILFMTAYSVLRGGPLNESTMIFIVIPFGHFISIGIGCVAGFIAYAIDKDI